MSAEQPASADRGRIAVLRSLNIPRRPRLLSYFVRLGGSPMSLKRAWRFRLAVARAESRRLIPGDGTRPLKAWGTSPGTRTVGPSLPSDPRRGTSGTVAPPDQVGHPAAGAHRPPLLRTRGSAPRAASGRPNHKLQQTGARSRSVATGRLRSARRLLNSAVRRSRQCQW